MFDPEVIAVRTDEQLNVARLEPWLRAHLPDTTGAFTLMQVGQYLDHHVTYAAIKSRVISELFGQRLTDDSATSSLHDVKIDAEYGGVCTQDITTRR